MVKNPGAGDDDAYNDYEYATPDKEGLSLEITGDDSSKQRVYNSVKNIKTVQGGKAYGLTDASIQEEQEYQDNDDDGPIDQQSNQFQQYDLKSGRHSQNEVMGAGLASENGAGTDRREDDYMAPQMSHNSQTPYKSASKKAHSRQVSQHRSVGKQ